MCGAHADIAKRAITHGWDDDQIERQLKAAELRASMPTASPTRHGRNNDGLDQNRVLEAAACMTAMLDSAVLEASFDERTLQAAHTRYRGMNLHQLMLTAAQANGYTGNSVKADVRGVLEATFGYQMQAAQFSTISLPNILSNVSNKFLLAGFGATETEWRKIAARRPATDFKEIASYRLTGDSEFEELAPGGEINHGTLGEEDFSNRLRSYAKMYGIPYQVIRNDDLGVITSLQQKLGRGAGLKLNSVFWAEFLDNATFFADPSQNYLKGSTTNLSAVGLTAALAKFRAKEDAEGKPLATTPKILLVPPALEAVALELMQATGFNTGGASTDPRVPSTNIYANRFQVVVSDYLGDETATTWYLLAAPSAIPTIEVAFLDGKETPTVESTDADFNTLGLLIRGHFHFGVAKQDPRGGLKVKGAA